MINRILETEELFQITRSTCEENGICVNICDNLMIDDQLDSSKIIILKIDKYYNSSLMHNPPPSVDCLVIIKYGENEFGLTLVELKNVSNARDIRPNTIRPKFVTVLDDFLTIRFSSIFSEHAYNLSYLKLWLVTNPYKWPVMTNEQYEKKLKGTVLELYLSQKPLRFRNKVSMIEHKPPFVEIC